MAATFGPAIAGILAGLAVLALATWRWMQVEGRLHRLQRLWAPVTDGRPFLVKARDQAVRWASRAISLPEIERRLEYAGRPFGWQADDLIFAKCALAVAGGVIMPWLASQYNAAGVAGGVALGWFAPDMWLSSREEARARHMREEAYVIADLLASVAAAGVPSLTACLQRVTARTSGPLDAELERALKEVSAGKALAEALEEVAARSSAEEVRRICTVLSQTHAYGGPMANVLREEAKQMWNLRMQKARERAGAIQPRLTVILALFMLFPLIIVIFGPYWPQLKAGFGAM